jgi:hypothetical protein
VVCPLGMRMFLQSHREPEAQHEPEEPEEPQVEPEAQQEPQIEPEAPAGPEDRPCGAWGSACSTA